MHGPNRVRKLHGIHYTVRITTKWQCNLKNPRTHPVHWLHLSALLPSAAIVNAVKQIDLAPSGNVWNSLRAELIQEIGRVLGTMGFPARRLNVVIFDNAVSIASHDGARELCYLHRAKPQLPGGRCYHEEHEFET